jgi:formate hydrogenlyase transcriptional activator
MGFAPRALEATHALHSSIHTMMTSPVASRKGKEKAKALFLDEIGDLPLNVQVRLLRVLEIKEFERVGATNTIRSDFRLIAATNTDLVQAIKGKKFREDLFYRINVFSIYVPPLRERREDIPLLINHFLKVQATETGKVCRPITDEEMLQLTQYAWPGNVRELKNMAERYAITGPASQTSIVDLLNIGNRGISESQQAVTLRENERRHILWALERTRGKIHGPGGAAELLEVHPNTLTFRIKKLGIQRQKSGEGASADRGRNG